MVLENSERLRFIEYAKQQVESCKVIAEQFAKSGLPAVAVELAKRERVKGMAYQVVVNDLESVSTMSIGSVD